MGVDQSGQHGQAVQVHGLAVLIFGPGFQIIQGRNTFVLGYQDSVILQAVVKAVKETEVVETEFGHAYSLSKWKNLDQGKSWFSFQQDPVKAIPSRINGQWLRKARHPIAWFRDLL